MAIDLLNDLRVGSGSSCQANDAKIARDSRDLSNDLAIRIIPCLQSEREREKKLKYLAHDELHPQSKE